MAKLWNLPPGVTPDDIDRHFGCDDPETGGCAECIHAEVEDGDFICGLTFDAVRFCDTCGRWEEQQ